VYISSVSRVILMELLIRPHPEGELQSIFTNVPGLRLLHVVYFYPLHDLQFSQFRQQSRFRILKNTLRKRKKDNFSRLLTNLFNGSHYSFQSYASNAELLKWCSENGLMVFENLRIFVSIMSGNYYPASFYAFSLLSFQNAVVQKHAHCRWYRHGYSCRTMSYGCL